MSDSKNRAVSAKLRHARVIKVAPVTRAIRAALAISATTLALTGSGAAFAANCPFAPTTAIHCSGAFETAFQPVIDLTTVHDAQSFAGAGDVALFQRTTSSGITTFGDAAIAPQAAQGIGPVQNMALVNTLSPGPGGTSGADDDVQINLNFPGSTVSFSISYGATISATSTSGIADDLFLSANSVASGVSEATLNASGYTWAAGMEVEAVDSIHNLRNGSYGTINASTTGKYGQAWGIYGVATNDVDVYNDGTINVSSSGTYGTAVGLFADAPGGTASTTNTGTINANASGYYGQAWGTYAVGNGDVSGSNSGDITVSSGDFATGMAAISVDGNAGINNAGGVTIDGYYGQGLVASTRYGDATVVNSGDVLNQTVLNGIGAMANSSYGNATSTNSGSIYTIGYYSQIGNYANASQGDATINNTGYDVAVSIYQTAQAIRASGSTANVVAGGDDSYVVAVSVMGSASGINAFGSQSATVSNDGYVRALSLYGGYAGGITAVGGDASITNGQNGAVVSQAHYGYAVGMYAIGQSGDASINNAGSVYARGYYGSKGIQGYANGNLTLTNSGSITSLAIGSSSRYAFGMSGYAANGDAIVANSGVVDVYSSYGNALGMNAVAYSGDTTLTNTGSLTVGSYAGNARGMNAYASYGDVTINNTNGGLSVYSGYGTAFGVYGVARSGDVNLGNSGGIDVYSYGSAAFGLIGVGDTVGVSNAATGVITVDGWYAAIGAIASASGNASLGNAGSISVTSGAGSATGALVGADGNATANNSGSIYAGSFRDATGIQVYSYNGDASLANSGSIGAYSYAGPVAGAMVQVEGGTATVVNSGSISADSNSKYVSEGVFASGDQVSITNTSTGSISATAASSVAGGVIAAYNVGDVAIVNDGSIDAAGVFALGVYASAYGTNALTNSGSISATGDFIAVGAILNADATVTVDNSGTISATSAGSAVGIAAAAMTVDIATSGDIVVNGDSSVGISAYGSAVSVGNTGNIAATSTGDAVVTMPLAAGAAAAPYADTYGITATGGAVTVSNGATGSIVATSASNTADGIRAYATGDVLVSNDGSIQATGVTAFGVYAGALGNASFTSASTGLLSATATTDAFGAFVYAQAGNVSVDNAGAISAATTGASYNAAGLSAIAYTGNVLVTNSGSISATSSGASATGLNAQSSGVGVATLAASAAAAAVGNVQVINSGSITATATGGASALGVRVQSEGTALVANSGTISATDPDYAVAVGFNATGVSTLYNTGVIRTSAPSEGQVAVTGGAGVLNVLNYGDISGAAIAGGNDDSFTNGDHGIWHLGNHITDFGGGADAILNDAGGAIALSNAAIHMGDSDGTGNSFTNYGSIQVRGTGLIDMGTTGSAANAQALNNGGIIDFVDGVPDDTLTIMGDLGGDGALNLDVSALTGSSDTLYVTGNMADGAAQSVNASFTGVPMPTDAAIPFAYITGDSQSGSFVPGEVIGFGADNFINLDVVVTSEIDASNASPDVFSLGVEMNGLNGAGALAATIAPRAKSLINSTIGTWRQRVGVLPRQEDGGFSPWVRLFSDKGDVDPSNTAIDFADSSDFGFDQDNTGREFGMNFALPGGFNYGVLLGKSKGTETLHSGLGSDRIDLSSSGVYATWLGTTGLYVDASYRWMNFDAKLTSAGGVQETSGSAEALNIEAGFKAWSLAGFDITPQAQYTHTEVGSIATVRGSVIDFVPEGGDSTRGRLGVGVEKTIENNGVIWTPYGALSAVKEFDGESRYTIADVYHGQTRTDGTGALLEVGLGVQKAGFSATGGLNWNDGGAQQGFLGGQLVLRYNW